MNKKRIARLVLFGGMLLLVWWALRGHSKYAIPEGDGSLQPRYLPGDTVVARRLDGDDPLERDVDVVYAMERDGVRYARFGRVRALPGDEVGVRDGKLTVNGELIVPPLTGPAMGTVPPDKLVILSVQPGRNRYPDSRQLGFIPRADVEGVIRFGW